MRKGALKTRTQRALILLGLMSFGLFIFFIRLVQLQVFQHKIWSIRSKKNHVSKRILEMKRGSILDRKGVKLAISMETYSVFIYTRELKSLSEAAEIISTVLPLTKEQIINMVGGKSGYIPIYKNLSPNLAQKLRKLAISGVNLEKTYKRYYPQGSLAANIIGFTGTDKHGLEGIELDLDKTLRGYNGLAVKEDISLNNGTGSKLRIVTPPMGGSNVKLTIDTFIQHTVEQELANLVKKFKPIDASAIVMDPNTGEILAMGCFPGYDLNNFSKSKPSQRRDRPLVDTFEPGSCMKIFAMASAIQSGKVDEGTRFYCRGYGEINGRRVRCHGAHGLLDANEAIAKSCNAAMVQVSQMVQPEQLYRTYRNAGFGSITGIQAPAESVGILRPPSKWSAFSETSLCIGQEMTATNIQLATAYSIIANGGYLLQPRIIKRITSPNGEIRQEFKKIVKRRVFPNKLTKWLRKMLRGVVDYGTGKLAKLKDYTVGGKTSTAQKPDGKGEYSREKVFVSFIGMAPVSNPKIVLIVEANEPQGNKHILYGGKVAAPTFARIMDRTLKYLKVPPDKISTVEDLKSIAENDSIEISALKIHKKVNTVQNSIATNSELIPDLTGKSLRYVINYMNKKEIKAILKGNGIVKSQSIPPGTAIKKSKVITVEFSSDS